MKPASREQGEPAQLNDVTTPASTQRRDQCGARKRQSKGRCTLPAGWGTSHPGVGLCKLHGGSMPNHVTHAARVATEAEARGLLERLGRPDPIGDPVEELLDLGAEVRAYLTVLRERLSELRDFSSTDVTMIDREKALVRLYGENLDRTHRVLADLARLGLDERLVRVREVQTSRLLVAVTRALEQLGLDADQQAEARRLIGAELRPGAVDKRLTRPADQGRHRAELTPGQEVEGDADGITDRVPTARANRESA